MRQQRTIAEKVSCTGLGLHCGMPVQLTLRPGRVDSGVVFIRRCGAEKIEIGARPGAVSSTCHATTLSCGSVRVSTVEHLLAALHSLRIDNVRVELDSPEVPAMEGSALSFVRLLHSAGVYRQNAPGASIRILRPVEVVDGMRRISIEPSRGLRISYAVEFEHPAIGRQEFEVRRLNSEVFEREIAPARTFGFLEDVDELWRAGLARGCSLENTIVLDDCRVMNPEGLLWPNECVRHKILDLIGDLALLGLPIQGHVRAERGGHSLHHRLLRALLESPQAWRVVDGVENLSLSGSLSDHASSLTRGSVGQARVQNS